MRRELLRSVAEDLLVYLDGPGNSTQRPGYRESGPIGKPAGAGMLDVEIRNRPESGGPIMEPPIIARSRTMHST